MKEIITIAQFKTNIFSRICQILFGITGVVFRYKISMTKRSFFLEKINIYTTLIVLMQSILLSFSINIFILEKIQEYANLNLIYLILSAILQAIILLWILERIVDTYHIEREITKIKERYPDSNYIIMYNGDLLTLKHEIGHIIEDIFRPYAPEKIVEKYEKEDPYAIIIEGETKESYIQSLSYQFNIREIQI